MHFFACMYVCTMCVSHAWEDQVRALDPQDQLWATCGFWELNLGFLQEQQMFLTFELPLHSSPSCEFLLLL